MTFCKIKRMRLASMLIAPAIVSVLLTCFAAAQGAGGTLTGTVTDQSGAVVTTATLTIKSVTTDVARTLTPDSAGFYSASNLTPGTYEITAVAPGFATTIQRSITLDVGDIREVDIHLQVGQLKETIEITADTGAIDLASSALSATVQGKTVRDLPLNGRDWTLLSTLEPGVQVVRTLAAVSIGNARGNRGLGTQMTISGNRPQLNNYRLDGISINDYSNGAPGSVLGINLGVDSIGEFSVVTSTPPADYGKSAGGVINAITRSGSNSFHGTLYEFLRNSALDARNYFDPVGIRPPFKRNQFGIAAGGPIGRDRTFIFGDYEGLRQSLSTPFVITVPSAAARSGHVAGTAISIDPQVAPFLNLFPLPNGAINGDYGSYSFSGNQVSDENFFTARLDHTMSPMDSGHFTYLFDDGKTTGPDQFNNILLGLLSRRQLATAEETHIFSPTLLNIFRFGFSRVVSEAPTTIGAINAIAGDTAYGFVPGLPAGSIAIPGITTFPGGLHSVGEYDFHFNSFQEYDDVNLTHGRHALKFGASLERLQANQLGNINPDGQYSFGSLSNFLQNKPTSFISPLPGAITPRDLRQYIAGVYVQDDWRAFPRLTLNLGLRHEFVTVPTEVNNELATLPTLTSSTPKLGSPYFKNPTQQNISPRVGFAWDPFGTGRTAVRSGFGLYDVLPMTYQFELLSIGTAPFFEAGSVSGLSKGTFPKGAYPLLSPSTLNYSYVDQNPKRDYVMQWNLNVQQQLQTDLALEIGYAGSHGVHEPLHITDANQVQPIAHTPQGYVWPSPRNSGTRLNPNVGSINSLFYVVSSTYHAGYLRLTRRLHDGMQFQGSYTWSKSLDTGSSTVAGGAFTNSLETLPIFDSNLRRGLSDFDVRQNVVLSALAQIPAPNAGIGKALFGGWQLNAIFQASGGLPFTPTIGGDVLGLKSAGVYDFPDNTGAAGCGNPVNPGNVTHYLKTQCFRAPFPTTRIGNSRRNAAIGPGLATLDPSLFKTFGIFHAPKEANIQFRAEFFNVLNHSNFGPPSLANSQVFNINLQPISTAGILSNTSTTSRQIQFALKINW